MKIHNIEVEDVQSVAGLLSFVRDALGTGNVRIVLPDGTVVSKAIARIQVLTDGSEIFEVKVL